ncbi:MAG: hypothetical protein PHW13_10315 [Methylococcales bacterium]|nr:hypothetical protein [Methylococcales bacterium]
MRTSWNDEEDDALQGLPLRAQVIYLRGIRRYMDYGSRVCGGPCRRISLGMLAETAQEFVNRQIRPKASKDCIRASIEQLKRAGLIERIADADYLIFFLPLADAGKSVAGNHPMTARQPAHDSHAAIQAAPGPDCAPIPPVTAAARPTANHPTHPLTGNQDHSSLPDGRAANTVVAPPYQAIVDLYHDCLPTLPRVYKLTDSRRRQMRALWADELDDLESWGNYFRHIARSDFLMGRSRGRDGSPFLASFDFIIHPAKFIKIAEEQYHGKKVQDRPGR